MCSSLSSSSDVLVIANNVEVTSCSGGCSVSAPQTLAVNMFYSENSDFGIAEMILWNRALSYSELSEAETYLADKYGFGIGSADTTVLATDTPSRLNMINIVFYVIIIQSLH